MRSKCLGNINLFQEEDFLGYTADDILKIDPPEIDSTENNVSTVDISESKNPENDSSAPNGLQRCPFLSPSEIKMEIPSSDVLFDFHEKSAVVPSSDVQLNVHEKNKEVPSSDVPIDGSEKIVKIEPPEIDSTENIVSTVDISGNRNQQNDFSAPDDLQGVSFLLDRQIKQEISTSDIQFDITENNAELFHNVQTEKEENIDSLLTLASILVDHNYCKVKIRAY